MDERNLFAVGQNGPTLERFADVVGMGGNRVKLDGRGQRKPLADRKARFAGRDIDVCASAVKRRDLKADARAGRRLVGEVHAYGRDLGLDFAGGVEMGLKDEVRIRRQPLRRFLRKDPRIAAYGPSAEVDEAADARVHAAVAGFLVARVDLARFSAGVGLEQAVVHDAAGSGPELDGAHPFLFFCADRGYKIAVDVGAVGGNAVRLLHFDNQVGLAELPALGQVGRRGQLRGVSLRHAPLDPLADQLDFFVGQAPLVGEAAVIRRGMPRRHVTRPGHGADQLRAFGDVAVAQQGKRPRLPGTVTGRAVVEDDRRDVLAKRHLPLRARLGSGSGKYGQRGERKNQGETDHGTASSASCLL